MMPPASSVHKPLPLCGTGQRHMEEEDAQVPLGLRAIRDRNLLEAKDGAKLRFNIPHVKRDGLRFESE